MKKPVIQFALLKPGAILPKRATSGAGAFDLFAPEGGSLAAHSRTLIPIGVAHQINDEELRLDAADGWAFSLHGFMVSRSGLAAKEGIRLFFEGLIDHDYRGEIHVCLENTNDAPIVWYAGDRLCQISYKMIFIGDAGQISPEELSVTDRGTGGHGSTGR